MSRPADRAGFQSPLRVESIDSKTWWVLEDFSWRGSNGDVFTVHAGAETDFATVPWWTQSLLPRTGTWTKAAVLHDEMCRLLNQRHQIRTALWDFHPDVTWEDTDEMVPPTVFSSVDTDAIFKKNCRDGGTGAIRAELLWLGVRYGALANPARRSGWLSTAPRILADTVLVLLALTAFLAVLAGLLFLAAYLAGLA